MLRILRLMHTQIVQEQCKVTTTEFLSDLINEYNKDLDVDRFRVYNIVDETMLFTNCGNQ